MIAATTIYSLGQALWTISGQEFVQRTARLTKRGSGSAGSAA